MTSYTGVSTDEVAGVPASTVANGSSAPVVTVTVTASPFSYTLPAYGTLNISGGTGVSVQLKRGGVTTNLGGALGHFLGSKGDTYVITYTTAPTVVFIPN